MNAISLVVFVVVVTSVFMVMAHKSYPFEFLLTRKIRRAAVFARDHHQEADISDWHWQEYREALVFWYNWVKRYANDVVAEYHEVFVLNSEGEAVDLVPPQLLWQRAIHLGLLRPQKTGQILHTGIQSSA